MVTHVSVRQARQQQDAGAVYLDVRSVPEFERAHPAGAYNVPLLHLDPATRQMRPNPDFVAVVKANFPTDARLLVGCQIGLRSVQAAELLASAGYQHVSNVLGGFGGSQTGDTGWVQAGLPVEATSDASRAYETLHANASARR